MPVGVLILPSQKPRATEPPPMPAPAPAWGRESSSLNGHAAAGCTSPLCPAARKAEAPPSCFNIFPGPSLVKKHHVSTADQHAGPPLDTAAIRWQHSWRRPSTPRPNLQLEASQGSLSAPGQARSEGTALLSGTTAADSLQQAASCPPCLVCAAPPSSAVNPSLPQRGRGGGGCFETARHRWLLCSNAKFT